MQTYSENVVLQIAEDPTSEAMLPVFSLALSSSIVSQQQICMRKPVNRHLLPTLNTSNCEIALHP